MEIDDNEFYQQDFTTASEWEIFNARLDEIFHEWKLPFIENGKILKKNELFTAKWDVRSVSIFFANDELKVSHYHAKIENSEAEEEINTRNLEKESRETTQNKIPQAHLDLMNLENNFCIYDSDRIHPIAKWYGLRDFVVIEPVNGPINASQYRVVLSSACMTAVETSTEIPVFVRVMQKELNVYLGVCESPSRRINFDIVALENTPMTCKYLSGLLLMFKGKISESYLKPVTVSVQFSYSLKEFCSRSYCLKSRIPFSNDQDEDENDSDFDVECEKYFALPYGVSLDPISELVLNCTWNEIAENVLVDSATYSDLDPMLASIWSIHCNYKQQSIYYLTDCLNDYIKLAENTRTIVSILGGSYDFAGVHNLEGGNPLALLTESKIPNLSAILPKAVGGKKKSREAKNIDGAIKEDELMPMLYYLFPDAEKEVEHPYLLDDHSESFDPMRIKSAAPDSLVFRLSCLLATCYSYFGGLSGMAQLWTEFTQEMRYRVERCIQIPGIASGFPDSRSCLLHQKLQMLNICMERRSLREGGLPFSMTESKGVVKRSNRNEDSDDEFYDCDNDDENENETVHAPWNKPEGRLEKLDNLMLIDSNEPLYIPICQDPVPKTEDQLEDDAEVMLKLGPGSDLCAQMMSASLLSDMESFKAANPNGKIEDFIRWYSPRDWIVEPDEIGEMKGRLSQRMLIPDNTWQVVWQQANPVSAKRQKRLFDDTKEAEKVLHFFETRTIGQICELTIAPLFQSAILKLQDELTAINMLDIFKMNLDKILATLCKLSRDIWILKADPPVHYNTTPKKYEKLLNEIANLENLILQSRSLTKKLFMSDINCLENKEKEILSNILKGSEAELENGAKNSISVQVLNLFSDARDSKDEFNLNKDVPSQLYLPDPKRKEYILRLNGGTTNGEGGPQFLRAILDKHMRLCGAFSENTTFVQ